MGRSVSYATGAQVVTFATIEDVKCEECNGEGEVQSDEPDAESGDMVTCDICRGSGYEEDHDGWRFEQLVEDFRYQLKQMFPSVENADDWIGREDHVLAENKLARFGISEYCGLVSYWIVRNDRWPYDDDRAGAFSERWIASIADKFVAAFGELTKVGSFSNGEGVYRRIDKA
jgi:hypothetical protein